MATNNDSKTESAEQDLSLIKGGRSFFLTLIICLAVFFVATGLLIVAFNRLISRHDQRLSAEICTIMSEKMNSSIEFMTDSVDDMASILSAQAFESPDEIYKAIKKNVSSDYLSAGFIDEAGRKYSTAEEAAEFDKWDLLSTAALADPVSISAPYRSSVYGQPVVTLFTRFRYGTSSLGYMFTTYKFNELQKIAVTRSLGDDIEIWLMHADSGNVIQCAGPDRNTIGSWTNAYLTMQEVNEDDLPVYKAWLNRVGQLEDNIGITYSVNETIYSQHCSMIKSMPGWYVVVRIPSNALSATMHTFRNYVISFLAVLLIVVIVLIANMYRMSKRDNEILERLSTHDPLTGVLNRRAFDHAARRWMERRKVFALIYFDLDYFKQVNDSFGHDAGDRLLVAFSDALKDSFSGSGIISRFGGDEFVVLTDMESVGEVNEKILRIREDISRFDLNGKNGSFTISFSSGASCFPHDMDAIPRSAISDNGEAVASSDRGSVTKAEALRLLMKQADLALYKVKERGRNGFLWYADLSGEEG